MKSEDKEICVGDGDGGAVGAVAQVEIPDTIHGKGFFIGQLNLAKHIMDFFLDKRDASNAAKLDSNYIGYYPEKLMFSSGLAQSGGWLSIQDDDSSFKLGSDISRSLSLRACYRGLAMVFALNPFNMFGNTDSEFDISFLCLPELHFIVRHLYRHLHSYE